MAKVSIEKRVSMGGLLTVPLKMVCIIRTNTCLCCGLNTFFHEGRGRVVNTPASYCYSMNDVTIIQRLFPAVHFSLLRQLRCKGKESYCYWLASERAKTVTKPCVCTYIPYRSDLFVPLC
jgi:hypothetical protein